MKVFRVSTKGAGNILDPEASVWGKVPRVNVAMTPTPLALVKEKSAFLALSDDHGRVSELEVSALHNNEVISLRLSWAVRKPVDIVKDLDEFADGVAVVFPLARNATAITMGSTEKPINAWYWKADKQEPYEVVAEGFGTSQRSSGKTKGLNVSSRYADGRWYVIFQRNLSGVDGSVNFIPGKETGIAFAIWAGNNKERSGRKSYSGDFVPLEIEKQG